MRLTTDKVPDASIRSLLGMPIKGRKRRTADEIAQDLRDKANKAEQRVLFLQAKEAAKTNPMVQSLLLTMARLKKERANSDRFLKGYTPTSGARAGETVIPPASELLARARAKVASLEARIANADTLPAELDESIKRCRNIIDAAILGQPVEIPADLIPEALRADPEFSVTTAEEDAQAEYFDAE